MTKRTAITAVYAHEILDSRGNPTVEATVTLADGTHASASVPSGASTGKYEAHELRDSTSTRYGRMGTETAVSRVNREIASVLCGMAADEQEWIDEAMITLDGTENRSNLGANAILSVSIATARAAACSYGMPLYRYLGGVCDKLPIPMFNVLNGGAHANNTLDVQEFMLVPQRSTNFAEHLRMGAETYQRLKHILKSEGKSTAVGDEGGFAPSFSGEDAAIDHLLLAAKEAGYVPGEDVGIALDVASSAWYEDGQYHLPKSDVTMTSDALIRRMESLSERYPIVSIEDMLSEDDTQGWQRATERLGGRLMLVGDDLFVTKAERIRRGIDAGLANAVLIKPNQVGTLTETARAIRLSREHGYRIILSHRSGETEDTYLADLAVAWSADYIKSGAPARSERTAKYNRLLRIERELHHRL